MRTAGLRALHTLTVLAGTLSDLRSSMAATANSCCCCDHPCRARRGSGCTSAARNAHAVPSPSRPTANHSRGDAEPAGPPYSALLHRTGASRSGQTAVVAECVVQMLRNGRWVHVGRQAGSPRAHPAVTDPVVGPARVGQEPIGHSCRRSVAVSRRKASMSTVGRHATVSVHPTQECPVVGRRGGSTPSPDSVERSDQPCFTRRAADQPAARPRPCSPLAAGGSCRFCSNLPRRWRQRGDNRVVFAVPGQRWSV
jgi:hypothetical protein